MMFADRKGKEWKWDDELVERDGYYASSNSRDDHDLRRSTLVSKSVQVTFSPDVDFPVDYRRCCQDWTVEVVSRQYSQLLTCIQYNHYALGGCNVDFVVGRYR